ncbi:hypothetical protein NBRC116494_30530 [Aurantivibrio plasticivorans]
MNSTGSINFGNWIRKRVVFYMGTGALCFLSAGTALQLVELKWVGVPLSVLGFLLSMFTVFLVYLFWQFSKGGYQQKMWQQTLEHCQPKPGDCVLDIGTGNGAIAIQLAILYPKITVHAIDLWAPDWEYSQASCELNATLSGVRDRTHFTQASASKLPYSNSKFDWVVSHFVFHEVGDIDDKKLLIAEALRVLKPGGRFVFHDMFLSNRHYGSEKNLENYLNALDIEAFDLTNTLNGINAPILLRQKKVFGCCATLTGEK